MGKRITQFIVDQEPYRIEKEHINSLPMQGYEGEIVLVDEDAKVPSAVEALKKDPILGFDTETRPAFKKGQSYPVALLQLATAEKVYLFQLLKINHIEPIWEILANPDYLKVGIAIQDDIIKLKDRIHFQQKGFIEIADLTRKIGILNTGLRTLVAHFLGFRISKKAQVSNWAKDELSESQLKYAATDAWVSRKLYLKINKKDC